ncbi:MAG: dockerin type I domain-containing protein [Oscillospiraceae bacterium]|nr:dockerin type I domain-containing protein [Oscillospiraceae bacterium]
MKNLNKKLSFGVALAMTSAILSCVPSVSASAVDSLNYPTDKDYDFHEVLEHYANDEQGNRQLVQEDIYYNFQSIYTGTYSLYERGYSYVFVTTNGKADKEELENELGKEVTAFSYYVGDKQYVYNYSKNEDYEKVYNIDGVEKVELARSKFSERCYIPVDAWGQNEWFKDNNIDPKKEKLIMADVYVENGFELNKDMFKDTGYDVVYVEKDNVPSSEENYDLWYVYFKYKGKESYTEFNKATEKIDKVHSSNISIMLNESATEGIDKYTFDIVKNPTIELPTQEITEPTKGTTATTVTTATTTTTEPKEIKLGDINGDDAIDSKDAVLVLKSYADALANNKTYYEKAADVNNDGKVDSKDAVEILKTYAKNLAENKA